ncbi:hypothetical protein NG796_04430 [Laspinema sp. A4]|uniref:hypothetical protein n=1 Tax=Laspinema sp. D2d TaxID=2953686 RepID=UPI0021BACCEB|nr:hypothetical protein [Laspinema sp. D2d]MCT7982534.1 hypothetical protein [Laspinema sp. D2d]
MKPNLLVNLSFRALLVGFALCLPLVSTVARAEEVEEAEESSAPSDDAEKTSPQYKFTVTNNTGSPITELYVDDAEQTEWGDSILGDVPIEPGDTAPFEWADEDWEDGDPCLYDVFTRSEDGTEGFAAAMNFCENPDIEVSPK